MKAARLVLVEVSLPVQGETTAELVADIAAAEQDLWYALRHHKYTIEAGFTDKESK